MLTKLKKKAVIYRFGASKEIHKYESADFEAWSVNYTLCVACFVLPARRHFDVAACVTAEGRGERL